MNILVAIDLTESSQLVIRHVKELAKTLSAKIWLLHVANSDHDLLLAAAHFDQVAFQQEVGETKDTTAKKFQNEHRLLHQFDYELRSTGLDCNALLVEGEITETILKEAAKLSADMVVLGSQGKGVVDRFLLGSTSEGILHKSSVPILIIPTHDQN